MQGTDRGVGEVRGAEGVGDVRQRNGADLAVVLGDDQIRPHALELVDQHAIDAQPVGNDLPDIPVDGAPVGGGVYLRGGEDGKVEHRRRVVTLVAPPHQPVPQSEFAQDFRGTGEQRCDAPAPRPLDGCHRGPVQLTNSAEPSRLGGTHRGAAPADAAVRLTRQSGEPVVWPARSCGYRTRRRASVHGGGGRAVQRTGATP